MEINWSDYLEQIDKLVFCIKERYKEWNKEYKDIIHTPYSCIIGINRGGNILGTILSHRLNIPLGIISATKYEYTDRLVVSKSISIIAKSSTFDSILLVDDISDTGDTLLACANQLKTICNCNIQIATVVYKNQSKVVPDFYVIDVPSDSWVKFPYELKGKPNVPTPMDLSNKIVSEYKEAKEVESMQAGKRIKEFIKEKAQDIGIIKDTRKTTGRAEQVAALIGENPKITNKEICQKTGIHPSYLPRILKRLRG